MTVTLPLVAPADGEVIGPQFLSDITEVVNGIATATPVQGGDSTVTDGSTTSTSYTNSLTTTATRGVVFTAPTSGAVTVSGQVSGRNSSAGGFTFADFEVRQGSTIGSGTSMRASDDNTAATFQSDSSGQQGTLTIASTLVTGLVGGTVYHAVLTYKVNIGTGTFNRRKITVTPT